MKLGRLNEKRRLGLAVKEALDTLPSAVCYFTAAGTIKLCNAAMYALYRRMTGSDLQSLEELNRALEDCGGKNGILRDGNVFLFPEGSAWQYSSGMVTAEGKRYTEVIFSNVTELYEKQRELRRQSGELKKMYRELKNLSETLLEMTREQEILNMKAQLHDQMNLGVAAIRQILRQNTTSAENAAAGEQFRRAIRILQAENAYPQDDVSEFLRDAEVMGVRVELSGELPKGREETELLLPVLREACVNAARHADATALYVETVRTEDTVTLRIRNNGDPPEREAIPQGGLADLKRSLEKAGGSMAVMSRPEFVLTVSVPAGKQKEEQEMPE